jgi:hypothetical protein
MDFTARDATKEEVRRRTSLLDLARERVPSLRRSGAEWRGPCPIHGGKRANFSVNEAKGTFYCHTCGEGGDVFAFAMKALGFTFPAAKSYLADRCGVRLDDPAPFYPPPAPRPITAVMTAAPVEHPALVRMRAEGCTPQLPTAVYGAVLDALTLTPDGATYLRGRGLEPDAAHGYGFRTIDGLREWTALGEALGESFCPDELEAAGLYQSRDDAPAVWSPPWAGRMPALVIPYKLAGECIAVRFRALDPLAVRRYHTLGGASPREPFNADALHRCAGRVLHIAEGELNAYALALAGCHAIGLPGALTWRDEWTERLADVGQLVAWFDDDPDRMVRGEVKPGTGHQAASRLRLRLVERYGRAWVEARVLVVKLPRDPEGVPLDANDLHQRGHLGRYIAEHVTPALP